MRYDLAALVRRTSNPRRKSVDIRPTIPTQALAADLYARAYKPIIARLIAALPNVVALYERSLPIQDGMVRDAASDDVRSFLSSLGDELQRIVLTLEPGLRAWSLQVERWQRGRWRGAVLSATGIDVETLLMASGTPQTVAETIAWNASLIRDVSDQARSRINNLVFGAVQQRKPARELASELRDAVGMSRRRSLLIASDQTQKLTAALDRERATEAGFSEYTWRWSHKKHGRAEHIARDGKVFRYDKPPHDGPPGSLPYCGCRAQARLVLSETWSIKAGRKGGGTPDRP